MLRVATLGELRTPDRNPSPKIEAAVMADACNSNTHGDRDRRIAMSSHASLGYLSRSCLKNKYGSYLYDCKFPNSHILLKEEEGQVRWMPIPRYLASDLKYIQARLY